MIDMSCIYSNPVIPPRDYLVRFDEILTEPTGNGRPLICVRVSIAAAHEDEVAGKQLHVLIHATEAADGVYDAFRNALDVVGDNYNNLVGRYAVVSVANVTYKKTKYSSIYFRSQTWQHRQYAEEAEKAEQMKSKAQAVS